MMNLHSLHSTLFDDGQEGKQDNEGLLYWPFMYLLTGAAEQVKQVKQLLHRNSEVLLQRNFLHLGYMKGEIFRASLEKSSFRRPWINTSHNGRYRYRYRSYAYRLLIHICHKAQYQNSEFCHFTNKSSRNPEFALFRNKEFALNLMS